MEWITQPEALIAFATLTSLEIVLGIDNIIFITIIVGRLPIEQRKKGRIIGLSLAMIARLALLFSLTWMMGLTKPLFSVFAYHFSSRDMILILGGLFLLAKSTHEIHHSLEGEEVDVSKKSRMGFFSCLIQIAIIDIIFSLDSVITAVGLVDNITIMVVAIVISIAIMMVAAQPIGDFVDQHPTLKILALSFLILVGVTLIAEGLDFHIPKGYIYFSMTFSVVVEILNLKLRARRTSPVHLRKEII